MRKRRREIVGVFCCVFLWKDGLCDDGLVSALFDRCTASQQHIAALSTGFVFLCVSMRLHESSPEGLPTMPTGTVRLHRVLRAPVERIYRAFLDPDAMAKWLPPYGFTCKVHHFDACVGGAFRMSFTNFSSGHSDSFGGEYLELVANERLRYTDRFDDPNLPGVMQVTVDLKPVSCGTELHIVQEGIPEMIPVEMCYLGWQESLAQLANLVEPEIPG
jgi:uncharacterized protein YndB with AHSA1/START domain